MHHIYTTQSFVINSSPYGEAGKFILLFTKDFGLIGATAQGIRLIQSKLRYHVQDYSFSNVSIVRGKEVWRLTGAHELNNFIKPNILHVRILKLLKRLLHGEEKNEKLFEIIESLYKTEILDHDFDCVEYLTVLRILNTLGYIRNNEILNKYLNSPFIEKKLIDDVNKSKKIILETINSALRESQL